MRADLGICGLIEAAPGANESPVPTQALHAGSGDPGGGEIAGTNDPLRSGECEGTFLHGPETGIVHGAMLQYLGDHMQTPCLWNIAGSPAESERPAGALDNSWLPQRPGRAFPACVWCDEVFGS